MSSTQLMGKDQFEKGEEGGFEEAISKS